MEKINRNTVPQNFTIGLAIFDTVPVLLFGIAAVLFGRLMMNVAFIIGALLVLFAGVAKALWKIIVVKKRKNIWWMFQQMRIVMPIGMLLMLVSAVISRNSPAFSEIAANIVTLPTSIFFIVGGVGMVLMIIFAFVLNNADPKSNWIEQITNAVSQFFILLGVILLCVAGNAYHADEIAQKALESTDTVSVTVTSDYVRFTAVGEIASKTGFVFYPGAAVEYTAYAPLMQKLAQNGVACFIVNMPLNFAFFGQDRALDVIKQNPQIETWYIGGHSLGGVVASRFIRNHSECNIAGIVLLASYADKPVKEYPVLSVFGSCDGVLNQESYQRAKQNYSADFTERVIEGGNHSMFASYGHQKKDGEARITAEEQFQITAQEILKFFKEPKGT